MERGTARELHSPYKKHTNVFRPQKNWLQPGEAFSLRSRTFANKAIIDDVGLYDNTFSLRNAMNIDVFNDQDKLAEDDPHSTYTEIAESFYLIYAQVSSYSLRDFYSKLIYMMMKMMLAFLIWILG